MSSGLYWDYGKKSRSEIWFASIVIVTSGVISCFGEKHQSFALSNDTKYVYYV